MQPAGCARTLPGRGSRRCQGHKTCSDGCQRVERAGARGRSITTAATSTGPVGIAFPGVRWLCVGGSQVSRLLPEAALPSDAGPALHMGCSGLRTPQKGLWEAASSPSSVQGRVFRASEGRPLLQGAHSQLGPGGALTPGPSHRDQPLDSLEVARRWPGGARGPEMGRP